MEPFDLIRHPKRRLDQHYSYLICGCSNDADGKREYESKCSCEKESPERQLNLVLQEDAKGKRHQSCHEEKQVKPPRRYVFVSSHKPRVDINLSL